MGEEKQGKDNTIDMGWSDKIRDGKRWRRKKRRQRSGIKEEEINLSQRSLMLKLNLSQIKFSDLGSA
jgi:hypothetical protein